MKTIKVDVGIIGASIGGGATAINLTNRGLSVALFDRSNFPRNKICGEGLSTLGLEELDLLGVGDQALSLPHRRFYGFRFFEQDHQSELSLAPMVHGVGIRRFLLDTLLLNICRSNGALVFLGSTPTVASNGTHEFSITTPNHIVEAKYLVYATGASYDQPGFLDIKILKRQRSRCGMSAFLTTDSRLSHPMVDIFVSPSIQACLTPVDEKTSTLSVLGSSKIATQFHPSKNREVINTICRAFDFRPHEVKEISTTSNIGRAVRRSTHPRIFLVGDSLQQLDPIGGMGMTQALVTSRLASDALDKLLHLPTYRQAQIIENYNSDLKKALRQLTAYTRLTYWSLSTHIGRATLGKQKAGRLAQEVLLSMHRQSNVQNPYAILSMMLLNIAGL